MTEQLITMILSMENIIVFAYARNSESLYKLAVVLTTLHCSYKFYPPAGYWHGYIYSPIFTLIWWVYMYKAMV